MADPIDEILLKIEQASALINTLNSSLAQAQLERIMLFRQRNARRDPIMRLPLEISGKIFVACNELDYEPLGMLFDDIHFPPTTYSTPSTVRAPLLLVRICDAWRRIAQSTPALWARLRLESDTARAHGTAIEMWLNSVRGLNLRLKIESPSRSYLLPAALLQQPNRLHTLDLELASGLALQNLLEVQSWPNLKVLSLKFPYRTLTPHASELLVLLQRAPALLTYHLDYWVLEEPKAPPAVQPPSLHVTHRALERLSFMQHAMTDPGSGSSLFKFFACLTLPTLTSLATSFNNMAEVAITAELLQRSGVALRSLMFETSVVSQTAVIKELLPHLDALAHLEFSDSGRGGEPRFFIELARNPSSFLPKLEHIVVRDFEVPRWNHSTFDSSPAIAVFEARASTLKSFALLWRGPRQTPEEFLRHQASESAVLLVQRMRPLALASQTRVHVGVTDRGGPLLVCGPPEL
ncbi:hypothetical protein HMN09_01139500 [Mycena chlorophos]|uniref:F-box domain-containing protein n=1 Tax=Mycena chlorophos TaxID=658473 RepID=A0A8H6S815_MYCCL|nr:hypothetical protein HMN09_01139500 [Mycena chlorophos]